MSEGDGWEGGRERRVNETSSRLLWCGPWKGLGALTSSLAAEDMICLEAGGAGGVCVRCLCGEDNENRKAAGQRKKKGGEPTTAEIDHPPKAICSLEHNRLPRLSWLHFPLLLLSVGSQEGYFLRPWQHHHKPLLPLW